jgi:excisionase family DNA binding protein
VSDGKLGVLEAVIHDMVREALREALPDIAGAVVAAMSAEGRLGNADLLDVDQAARLAGVKPRTIRSWAGSGKVRVSGAGRPYRFKRSDLDDDLVKLRGDRRRKPRQPKPDELSPEEWARQQAERERTGAH